MYSSLGNMMDRRPQFLRAPSGSISVSALSPHFSWAIPSLWLSMQEQDVGLLQREALAWGLSINLAETFLDLYWVWDSPPQCSFVFWSSTRSDPLCSLKAHLTFIFNRCSPSKSLAKKSHTMLASAFQRTWPKAVFKVVLFSIPTATALDQVCSSSLYYFKSS